MTEDASRVITLGKYTIVGGFGCWAKSFERGVELGQVRMIGGLLMYAYSIYPRGFRKPQVSWVPADKEIGYDAAKLRDWSRQP